MAKGVWGTGYRKIEEITTDDQVASRDEYQLHGEIAWKRVEELFTRTAPIMEVWVNGQRIATTAEHPFYHLEHGWIPASTLTIGDQLASLHGEPVIVTNIVETNRYEPVYNLRVQDHHTYFVGSAEWGFSVWAHNAECAVVTLEGANYVVRHQGKELFKGDAAGLRAYWQANPGYNLTTAEGQRLWVSLVPEAQLQAEIAAGVKNGVKPTVVTRPSDLSGFADKGETLIWVRMRNGELRVHPETVMVDGVPKRVLHTQLSGGEPVLSAGQINGVRSRGGIGITEMTANSGHHFSPEFTKNLGRTHEPQVIHGGLEQAWAEMERLGIPVRNQYGPPK